MQECVERASKVLEEIRLSNDRQKAISVEVSSQLGKALPLDANVRNNRRSRPSPARLPMSTEQIPLAVEATTPIAAKRKPPTADELTARAKERLLALKSANVEPRLQRTMRAAKTF